MTIKDVWYILSDQMAGKGLFLNVDMFNRYAPIAQYELFEDLYGRIKDNEGAETNMVILEALNPFKTTSSLSFVAAAGVGASVARASDVNKVLSMIKQDDSSNYTIPVEVLTSDEVTERLGNSITAPTSDYPVCELNESTFFLYPNENATVNMTYYKYMGSDDPLLALDANSEYDSGNSTDFVFDDEYILDLVRKIMTYLNVPTTPENTLSYTEQKLETDN